MPDKFSVLEMFEQPDSTGTQKGLVSALLSALSFGLMGFLVHSRPEQIPATEMSFFRALVSCLLLIPFTYRHFHLLLGRESRIIWLRSLAGTISLISYFYNLQSSGVGVATMFADFSPIFVATLSYLFLKERISLFEVFGVILAVLGVYCANQGLSGVISPFLFIVGIGGAFFGAIAYLSLRQASKRYSSYLVVWCFSLTTLIASLFVRTGDWVTPHGASWAHLGGVALTGLTGQILMTRSYYYLRATVACAIGVTALFWGVLFDLLFHGEMPTPAMWLGFILVSVGVYCVQNSSKKERAIV